MLLRRITARLSDVRYQIQIADRNSPLRSHSFDRFLRVIFLTLYASLARQWLPRLPPRLGSCFVALPARSSAVGTSRPAQRHPPPLRANLPPPHLCQRPTSAPTRPPPPPASLATPSPLLLPAPPLASAALSILTSCMSLRRGTTRF